MPSKTKEYAKKKKTAKPSDLGKGMARKAADAMVNRHKILKSI